MRRNQQDPDPILEQKLQSANPKVHPPEGLASRILATASHTSPARGRTVWRFALTGAVCAAVIIAVAVALFAPDKPAAAAPASGGPGSLYLIVKPGEKLLTCPLEHTDVEGWITGDIAHVRVTQRFGNPYDHPIEAVYVFPLPENAAVNEMVMQIGERTIRGVMKKREEAKATYEQAKAEGKTASLLEQERPNIFTQSVANIMPGNPIEITIWYIQDLQYDGGKYNFVFPMVVAPRYIPGAPMGQQVDGWSQDTDQVPDASRITPPVLMPAERTGHDISLLLHLDAGVPVYDLACKSHETDIGYDGRQPVVIKLNERDTIPNKDFDVSWRVAGEKPEVGVINYQDDRSGYFTLLLLPKANFASNEITPKEMVFCLDTSGSMGGEPVEKSKEVVKQCLAQMGPRDTFQVVRFANDSSTFAPAPVPATRDNITKATEFIDALAGDGGTEMLGGIEKCLDSPANPNQVRIVAFLTDGQIGNETQILARIQKSLSQARIFSFGIGSSVNRYLLTKMAEVGRGSAQFVRQDENPDEAVQTFVERIARPYLTDLNIDWGGLEVTDLCPSYVPDLFADQPMILHGRYTRPGTGTIILRGRAAGQPWETSLEVDFTQPHPENEAIGVLWARTAIEDLMDQMYEGEDPKIVAQVTDLALTYRLMSQYTSFVAVEERVVNRGGKLTTEQVPVQMPEGQNYEGVFGSENQLGFADGNATWHYRARAFQQPVAGAPSPTTLNYQLNRHLGGTNFAVGKTPQTQVVKLPAPINAAAVSQKAKTKTSLSPYVARGVAGGEDFAVSGLYVPDVWLALLSPEVTTEASEAVTNLYNAARATIGLPAGGVTANNMEMLPELLKAKSLRVLILTGKKAVTLDKESRTNLAGFLRRGGFLLLDGANESFMQSVLKALLPVKVQELPANHACFTESALPFSMAKGVTGARGLILNGRLVGYISPTNLAAAWSKPENAQTQLSYRMGVNVLSYALRRQNTH